MKTLKNRKWYNFATRRRVGKGIKVIQGSIVFFEVCDDKEVMREVCRTRYYGLHRDGLCLLKDDHKKLMAVKTEFPLSAVLDDEEGNRSKHFLSHAKEMYENSSRRMWGHDPALPL